jgi:hypothetical protein
LRCPGVSASAATWITAGDPLRRRGCGARGSPLFLGPLFRYAPEEESVSVLPRSPLAQVPGRIVTPPIRHSSPGSRRRAIRRRCPPAAQSLLGYTSFCRSLDAADAGRALVPGKPSGS